MKSIKVIRGDTGYEHEIEIAEVTHTNEAVVIQGMDYNTYIIPNEVFTQQSPNLNPSPARGRLSAAEGRKCEQCGKNFTPQSDANRFCSKECYRENRAG
jgi:protein-arginine kinase activator protein McsA